MLKTLCSYYFGGLFNWIVTIWCFLRFLCDTQHKKFWGALSSSWAQGKEDVLECWEAQLRCAGDCNTLLATLGISQFFPLKNEQCNWTNCRAAVLEWSQQCHCSSCSAHLSLQFHSSPWIQTAVCACRKHWPNLSQRFTDHTPSFECFKFYCLCVTPRIHYLCHASGREKSPFPEGLPWLKAAAFTSQWFRTVL